MKKRIISLILAVLTAMSVLLSGGVIAAEESPYTDVKTGRWSYEDIKYVSEKGLMNGTTADKFAPAETMTRAMVVTVLYRLEGEPEVQYQPVFEDIKENKWFTDAVIWAADNKIVNGVETGKYAPTDNVTREQLATIIKRYSDYKLIITDAVADITGYADYKRVHDYAKEALSWANAVGLITGKTEDTLAPREGATREQFAAILRRFTEYDFEYILKYNIPTGYSQYTEKEYPLVTDADIYVAVDGDDSNAGTLDAPIATFEHAVELVRELKKNATDEIKVAFKAGNYGKLYVNLTEEDSGTEVVPITYCAYGDGDVIFQNGITITQDMFKDIEDSDRAYFTDKYEADIKKVDLSALLDDGDVISKNSQLVNNGQRMNQARFPNKTTMGYSESFITDPVDGRDDWSVTLNNPAIQNKFKNYHTFENTEIIGYLAQPYMCNAQEMASYDPETNIITFADPAYQGTNNFTNQFTFFSNISEELDYVNEYWVDVNNKTLYVYAPDTDYVLTTRDLYVDCKADYVSFVGFEFCGSSGEFFHVEADHVTVKLCDMYVGGGLMALRVKGTYFTLSECELSYLAGGGILLEDDVEKVTNITPNGSLIDNNSIHDYLLKYKVYLPAVRLFNTVGVRVSHNEIYNSTHSAIHYGHVAEGNAYLKEYGGGRGIDNIIEYNIIRDVCEHSGDCGAIYSDRCFANPGNIIRYNLFNHLTLGSGHQCAIYLGDGVSYQQIYGNIFFDVYDVGISSDGRGTEIKDNVFIKSFNNGNDDVAITFGGKYRGMVLEEGVPRLWQSPTWETVYNSRLLIPDESTEAGQKWKSRWPKLYEIEDDLDRADELINDPDFVVNVSYAEITGNYMIGDLESEFVDDVELFCEISNNPTLTTEENPLFTNPTLGDYSIKEGVDFLDNQFSKIGRY
ncbi:MAG: S-layer homology domain-containing protein [Clostridia bacterium]|nr:S-layer homology domain-containing protein [Clostridia bacterium]